ncbi:MAG TPA: phage Gp37/Gp68 family protein [Thermoanaerobaculia bacterium]|jgi:protein gp37|nr:phage Gp37/Gp68 family protein [Thermoanaerobaculia bacterium]
MSDKSKIEWTDATWNPTRGCSKIAPGCAHCYAETFAERFRGVKDHPYEFGFNPRIVPEKLSEPLKWKTPKRIFVDSMSDLFHEAFPFEYIAQCFSVMSLAEWHTFQILTKRLERAAEFFRWVVKCWPDLEPLHQTVPPDANVFHRYVDQPAASREWERAMRRVEDTFAQPLPLPNVWIGTSIANQVDADKNVPLLLQIPAAVRFLSVEPLIGPVNLDPALCEVHGNEFETDAGCSECQANGYLGEMNTGEWLDPLNGGISWVIIGGESGPHSRPCHVDWIRSVRDRCRENGVPLFVKQLGRVVHVSHEEDLAEWGADHLTFDDESSADHVVVRLSHPKGGDLNEWPADLRIREFPEVG